MKENSHVFIESVESKMIRYKEHERRLRTMHYLYSRLAVLLMLAGVLYPALYLLHQSPLQNQDKLLHEIGYYLGYVPIILSVCVFLYIQMFIPKERIISLTLLNNRLSSAFDDYTLGLVPVQYFKLKVELLIEEYISSYGDSFFLRNNY